MHSDDLVHITTGWAEMPNQAKLSSCPHWDPSGRNCRLVTDGLFLPVEQHATAYCQSSHYAACSHFQLLTEKSGARAGHDAASLNRRRSIRIPDRHFFRFSEITASDQFSGFREDNAWTVDLSDHGIRFATHKLLPLGTTLLFQVDTGCATSSRQGIGRVIWSQPIENSLLFHTGIALIDSPVTL